MKEREEQCEELEVEIVSPRSELNDKNRLYRKLEEEVVFMKKKLEKHNISNVTT